MSHLKLTSRSRTLPSVWYSRHDAAFSPVQSSSLGENSVCTCPRTYHSTRVDNKCVTFRSLASFAHFTTTTQDTVVPATHTFKHVRPFVCYANESGVVNVTLLCIQPNLRVEPFPGTNVHRDIVSTLGWRPRYKRESKSPCRNGHPSHTMRRASMTIAPICRQ